MNVSVLRDYKIWEYYISHGQLLIRSPKGNGQETNIDIICQGLEYIAAPKTIENCKIDNPTDLELTFLSELLKTDVDKYQVKILLSGKNRFPVVAGKLTVSENTKDIDSTPFERPFDDL